MFYNANESELSAGDLVWLVPLVLAIVVIGLLWPLAIIWAVNTLFGLGIAYTFINWLAVLVLAVSFGKANVPVNKDK